MQNLYKHDRTISLVTNAEPLNQNIALLDVDEQLNAEALAVIHHGYVNIVPIIHTEKRSKYVPLLEGSDRGKGKITQVRWVKIQGETLFVVLSDNGLLIYDAEITDVKYHHACRETGDERSYTIGVCVVRGDVLCIGTHLGTVWMFTQDDENAFVVSGRYYAHDEALTLMDGYEDYMVTSSDVMTYVWLYKGSAFDIIRKLDVPGLFAKPTAMKVTNCMTFIGYESGEFCIFDFFDENFISRTVGHTLKVTSIDFSALTGYILTCSQDGFVKVWKFKQNPPEATLLQSFTNADGPACGAGFLNYTCTEFCVIASDTVNVNFYLKWTNLQTEDETESKEKLTA